MKVGVGAFTRAANRRDPLSFRYLLAFLDVSLGEVRVLRRYSLAVV